MAAAAAAAAGALLGAAGLAAAAASGLAAAAPLSVGSPLGRWERWRGRPEIGKGIFYRYDILVMKKYTFYSYNVLIYFYKYIITVHKCVQSSTHFARNVDTINDIAILRFTVTRVVLSFASNKINSSNTYISCRQF